MKAPKSKYKGVYPYFNNGGKQLFFQSKISINGKIKSKGHKTEIEAAKHYDLMLIEAGREPVNILKRK